MYGLSFYTVCMFLLLHFYCLYYHSVMNKDVHCVHEKTAPKGLKSLRFPEAWFFTYSPWS